MHWNAVVLVVLLSVYVIGALNIAITDEGGHHTIRVNTDGGFDILNDGEYSFHWPPPQYHTDEEDGDGNDFSGETTEEYDAEENYDSWSIVWYIASFGGLITFFLVVSCSEWCCRKHVRDQQQRRTNSTSPSPTPTSDAPPPAYDLFAPPSYDSLSYGRTSSEKSEYDVFVVPVHTFGSFVEGNGNRQEEPPSYSAISVVTQQQRQSASNA